jgi:protein TonB
MIVVPDYKRPEPIIRKLAPPQSHPRPEIRRQQVEQPITPVDTTPGPTDIYVEPTRHEETITDFGDPPAVPTFAQIRADIAPPPPYPAQALRRQLSGVVQLKVLVDAQGHPIEATIDSSSGSKLLDEAALKFVLARWHFVPAMQDGRAVDAYALVPISFVLER